MDNEILQSFKEFSVSIYGSLTKYNDVLSKGRCRIFYKGPNRNGTFITDEFAEQLLLSLPYTPVKGIYDGDDFTDHGPLRSKGRIYGIVPENPNIAWENHEDEDGIERTYACADVLLFTAIYEEAGDIVGKAQSMELYDKAMEGEWQFIEGKKYFVFTKGCFLGLQVLGEEVEPCFEGAAFFSLYESLTKMVEKIDNFNLNFQQNRQGGNEMPTINFKLSDDQKYSCLWNLLNNEFNEAGNWTVSYGICDVYDGYAVVRNYEKNCYERAYYMKNDADDSVSIDKMETCYIVDVTESEKNALATIQALNGGTYEKIDENFVAAEVNVQQKEELEASIATLTMERDEAQNQYSEANTLLEEAKENLTAAQESLNALQTERDELAEYKMGVETAEKKEVIASYAEVLSEEVLGEYEQKLAEYTVSDLDKELAYEVKKANPSVFSKNNEPASSYVPKDVPLEGLEAILSKYSK